MNTLKQTLSIFNMQNSFVFLRFYEGVRIIWANVSLTTLLCLLVLMTPFCSRLEADLKPGGNIFVVERETGKLAVIDYREMKLVRKIQLSGNLRHATMVFGPELRYAYLASRNGILSRINILTLEEDGAIATSENSIGLGISQDGNTVAVSEYKPGGVTFVDTRNFKVRSRMRANVGNGETSRVTGLVDGPDNTFLCAYMDSNEIRELVKDDASGEYRPGRIYKTAVNGPFDALITPEGRYYITGHMNSHRVSVVDLWDKRGSAKSVKLRSRDSELRYPIKMPHMETWAVSQGYAYMPLVGEKQLAVVSTRTFKREKSIPLVGNPVYAVIRPDQREIWVTFSGEADDGKIQVVDLITHKTKETILAGKRIYHLVFTPRGDLALATSNKTDELLFVNTRNKKIIKRIKLDSPSGIFGVWRAFRMGL